MAGIHTPRETTELLERLLRERPQQNWRDTSNRGHSCDSLIMTERGNVCNLFLDFSSTGGFYICCNGDWSENLGTDIEPILQRIHELCLEERIIEAGTIIKITKPYDNKNWEAGGMDRHVGTRAVVRRVDTRHDPDGTTLTSCKIDLDEGYYNWVIEHGHFVVIDWRRRQVEAVDISPIVNRYNLRWMDYLSSEPWGTKPIIPEFKYSVPKTPKYPDRTPRVGDWVQITKSKTRWDNRMNEFVGQYFKVEYIRHEYSPARYSFENMPYKMQECRWEFKSKHFKKAGEPKEIKRPLVLSKSFKTFVESIYHESKLARMLLTAMEMLEFGEIGQRTLASRIITGDEVSYLTFRTDGTISYLPKGKKLLIGSNGKWSNEGRQSGKPAKILRKLFTPNALRFFKESDFELFNNKYKARFSTEGFEFKELPHDKIVDIYNTYRDDRADGDASLNGSCMNIDYDSERSTEGYFEMYTNCKQLSIITLTTNTGKLAGRALLWKATIAGSDKEITFMDRVYVVKDHLYDAFVEYAIDHGYHYKKWYKSRENGEIIIDPKTGEDSRMQLEVKTPTEFDYYPYVDTFCWGDDGILRNYEDKWNRYVYCDTRGGRDDNGPREVYDEITQHDIPERDSVIVTVGQYRNCRTHVNNTVTISGRIYWREDPLITYSDYYEKFITRAGSVFIKSLNTMVKENDAIQVTAGSLKGEWILQNDAVEIGNKVYHRDDEIEVSKS